MKINNRFQRKLGNFRAKQSYAAPSPRITRTRYSLETIGHIAQISLAVVAIFGYFYTVLPVYQKERLAEQVAEYEGIIKKQTPKIAETERRLAELQSEREKLSIDLQQERTRLTQELKSIERQLSSAREQKNKIESQIQYMTFRYRLPDGSPAVTPEQVKTAQVVDLKRSFLSSLSMSCAFGFGGVFPPYSYEKKDEKNKFWPFTEKEVSTWKDFGTKYPSKRATECIDSVAQNFSQRYGKDNFSAEIERFRNEAAQYANSAATKPWTPPLQPDDLLQELNTKRATIEAELVADLKKVEEQYGDWESTFGESRRAIFKHNYEVGKKNAQSKAISARISLDFGMQEKANLLRKSINEEIKRLIVSERKNDSKLENKPR